MSDPLDQFFSPDRLRRKWAGEEEAPPEAAAPPSDLAECFERFRALAAVKFEGTPVMRLVEELGRKLLPSEGEQQSGSPEELAAEIEELLIKIENLADVVAMRRPGGRR